MITDCGFTGGMVMCKWVVLDTFGSGHGTWGVSIRPPDFSTWGRADTELSTGLECGRGSGCGAFRRGMSILIGIAS